ncbi:MAG: sigma 54-interacting transcriptional regulator [Deltaproteobacteria bacterium]|jgi:transcriptional regulator with PAS, ATPase and Fis domain|nr:sigma 54-interacting transcriptional regulator [Deltaproteobacteria bacterium]
MNAGKPSIEEILKENCIRILDSIYDGILIVDANSIVIYVNPEYLRIVRLTYEDIRNKPLRDVRPGAILPDVVRTGRSVEGALRREGDTEYVVDMSPIIMNGAIVGGISVVKDLTEVQRLAAEAARFQRSNKQLWSSIRQINAAKHTFDDIVHQSPLMADVVASARSMALSRSAVMIMGESGTGKEVFAQAIHNASLRKQSPFLALNCASLTPTVIESELFGYVDGAFTGAQRGGKAGFFEVADGGTLFLDEVTELPLSAQAKLLRVLQEKTIRRVGDTNERDADVRVIAASNRNLQEAVAGKRFRADLFYRLNVLPLHLPPLRERGNDVSLLARFFLGRLLGLQPGKVDISPAVTEAFTRHVWPGNVRELRNVMEYAVHMGVKTTLEERHIPASFQAAAPAAAESSPSRGEAAPGCGENASLADILGAVERDVLSRKLSARGQNLAAKKIIARELGISLTTLYAKLGKYQL